MRKRAKFSMTPKILPLTGGKTAVLLLSETYMTRDRREVWWASGHVRTLRWRFIF